MSENDATTPETEVAYSEDDAAQDLLSRWSGKPEADPVETEQEGQASEGEEPEAEQAEAQADAEEEKPEAETEIEWEVEFGGQTRKLPKGVPEAVAREVQEFGKSLHADYTKKTQEVAEQRAKAQADATAAAEMLKLTHEHADLIADFRMVQRQIDTISQTDLYSLSESDPLQAQQQMARLVQLQQAQQRIGAQLQTTVAEMQSKHAQAAQQRLAEAEAKLQKEMGGKWGQETKQALTQYAKSLGFSDAELSQVSDPRVVMLMHKAQQYDALSKAKPAVTKKVSEVSKTIKPSAATTPQAQKRAQVDDAMKRLARTGSRQDAEAVLLARLSRN